MSTLAELKKRGVIKANLTRFEKFIQQYDPSKVCQTLYIRLSKANDLWVEFENVQEKIELLDTDVEDSVNESERDSFYSTYFDIVGRLDLLETSSSNLGNNIQPQVSPSAFKTEVRLPPMEIPTFYGSYKN